MKTYLVILMTPWLAVACFSQEKKISLEIGLSAINLKGQPSMQLSRLPSVIFGINDFVFARKISLKWLPVVMDIKKDLNANSFGEIVEQDFHTFTLGLDVISHNYKKWEVTMTPGISYRKGSEYATYVFLHHGSWGEFLIEDLDYCDLGFNVNGKVNYDFFKRLYVGASLDWFHYMGKFREAPQNQFTYSHNLLTGAVYLGVRI